MFHNYLAAALRNLVRNRLYAAINIIGLTVGLAATVLIGLYVRDELTYDTWIRGHENTFVVYSRYHLPGRPVVPVQTTWAAVAGWLKAGSPLVEDVTRVTQPGMTVRRGEIESRESRASWVDPNFFRMFPLPVVAGDPATALDAPDGVVITRAISRKYFGRDDSIGETLEVNNLAVLRVTAVIEDLPSNTHMTSTMFASGLSSFSYLKRLEETGFGPNQIQNDDSTTYVRLRNPDMIAAFKAGLPALIKQNLPPIVMNFPIADSFELVPIPITDIHLLSRERLAVSEAPDVSVVVAFSIIGGLIMLVAVINFVNLMTARAGRRGVEVGVRKTSGAARSTLMVQFIGEAFLYALMATALALALTHVLLPQFNGFLRRTISAAYLLDPVFGGGVLALTAVTGLLAGLYPAFILSAFRPAVVLKSFNIKSGGGGRLRRGLVILQFAVLISLLLATVVIHRQSSYAIAGRLRLPGDQIAIVTTSCAGPFKAAVQALPGVQYAACSSSSAIGFGRTGAPYKLPDGTVVPVRAGAVERDFFAMYGLKPIAGQLWENGDGDSETSPRLVLNEDAVRQLGFASPQAALGQTLKWPRYVMAQNNFIETQSEIIGVVPDFSMSSVREAIEPTFYFASPSLMQYLHVKLAGETMPETLVEIDRLWRQLGEQKRPVQRVFLDQRLRNLHLDITRQSFLLSMFAGVAVFISCLGLLGLSAFTAETRTKEIGVRKAMGANTADVLRLLGWQFAKPVLLANVIAWPAAYFSMRYWLSGFAYRIDLDLWLFPAASGVALIIAMLTVSGHALLVARAQPVTALRYE